MKHHILIVEDDDAMRDALARALNNPSYHIDLADNGTVAIALLQKALYEQYPYEVVISDMVMGEVDGIQVLQAAMNLANAPEVIILTGHGTIDTAVEAIRSRAFDYLIKPCKLAILRERVQDAILYYWQRTTQKEAVDTLHVIAQSAYKVIDTMERLMQQNNTITTNHPRSLTDNPFMPHQPTIGASQRYISCGTLSIDTYSHKVSFNNQPINLTPIEYALLICLAATPERVIEFTDIAFCTHGKQLSYDEARLLLTSHVHNLRKKIDRHYIVSVPRIGYMLVIPH